MPGSPIYKDKEAEVLDNRRRNPKIKGRPNEFVMREQLDSTSENESKRSSDVSSSSNDGSVNIRLKSSSRSTKVCSTPTPSFIFMTPLIPNTTYTAEGE